MSLPRAVNPPRLHLRRSRPDISALVSLIDIDERRGGGRRGFNTRARAPHIYGAGRTQKKKERKKKRRIRNRADGATVSQTVHLYLDIRDVNISRVRISRACPSSTHSRSDSRRNKPPIRHWLSQRLTIVESARSLHN